MIYGLWAFQKLLRMESDQNMRFGWRAHNLMRYSGLEERLKQEGVEL